MKATASSIVIKSKRLLIISPNWIGDTVMAQPLLQLLKMQYPLHAIDVMAPSWVAPVLKAMIEVDTVLETSFLHGALQLRERTRYARILRKRGYDAAYILSNTLKFALLPWMAGIKKRVGYKGESRYGFINVMHFDDKNKPRAMVPFYAALAYPPKQKITEQLARLPKPHLFVSDELRRETMLQLGLSNNKPLVCFSPGAEFGSKKRWPASHFANLAKKVLNENPDIQIALLGSLKDTEVCLEIQQILPQVHQLAGKTNLDQAVAIISGAIAVISNDSGLLHIASALNRPVFAIYGPTDPDHAPPFSDLSYSFSLRPTCAPCDGRDCPLGHHDCMQKISPDMLWQPLKPLLPPVTSVTKIV